MEPIANKKAEKKFRKFQLNKKIVSFKKAIKKPDKYPYVNSFDGEIIEWIFIYPDGWYIVQYINSEGETKFYVPFEGMQPVMSTLELAELVSFEYIEEQRQDNKFAE